MNGEDKTPEEEREINLLAGGIAMSSPTGYVLYQRHEHAKALAKDAEYKNTPRARLFERAEVEALNMRQALRTVLTRRKMKTELRRLSARFWVSLHWISLRRRLFVISRISSRFTSTRIQSAPSLYTTFSKHAYFTLWAGGHTAV